MDFPIYTDPSRAVYRAFEMRNDKLSALKPKAWKNALRAKRAGFKQTGVRGDPFQNGGVVVVLPNGAIPFVHVESEVGDLADLDAVIAALGKDL